MPDKIKRAAYPIAGTYNCRAVADTGQPSPHGYGIAIDLNTAVSDYWYWRPHDGAIVYRNRMPEEIVAIFEKHGFIWAANGITSIPCISNFGPSCSLRSEARVRLGRRARIIPP